MRRWGLYLRFVAATVAGGLVVWIAMAAWISLAPLSVLNRLQPILAAKESLLDRCEGVDGTVVFGDSRADAGIDPDAIKTPVLDLARAAGNPLIDFYRIRRLLACPNKPRLVILSYSLGEFTRLNNTGLWEDVVYSHLLPYDEEREIVAATDRFGGEAQLYHPLPEEHPLEHARIPAQLRLALYRVYFPPFYGPSLLATIKLGVLMRVHDNDELYWKTFAHHGYFAYPPLPRDVGVAKDAFIRSSAPVPLIRSYFEKCLDLLRQSHIPTLILLMPVNHATDAALPPSVRRGLIGYLASASSYDPGIRLADLSLPVWPAASFDDTSLHASRAGTVGISTILDACLRTMDGDRPACSLAHPPPTSP